METDLFDSHRGIPENQITDRVARANAIAIGGLRFKCAVPHVLCDRCKQLAAQILAPRPSTADDNGNIKSGSPLVALDHFQTFAELSKSAKGGCHLCAFLDDVVLTRGLIGIELPHYCIAVNLDRAPSKDLRLLIWPQHNSMEDVLPPRQIAHNTPVVPLRTTSTESNDTFKCASKWLQKCLKHHGSCTEIQSGNGKLPPRLLEIASKNRKLHVRLRSSQDIISGSNYICLSHCWGKSDVLNLIHANKDSLVLGIDLEQLPQTFLDAVVIAYRLGFQYLWIDSLCIIQDSQTDWADHVPLMGDIYRNAKLVIAALTAQDDNGGCFARRDPLIFAPCRLLGPHHGNDPGFMPSTLGDHRDPDTATYPKRPPLLRRAWVVQERALATRTLHFGEHMVYWECLECRASETFPEFERVWTRPESSISPSGVLINLKLAKPDYSEMWRWNLDSHGVKDDFLKLIYNDPGQEDNSTRCIAHWWRVISAYTACDLTFPNDRPAAFAGIAKTIEQSTGQQIVHGLFSEALHFELLWIVSPKQQQMRNRAPSWSWFSVDGGVRHAWIEWYVVDARIVETARTRRVSESKIELTAPLMAIHSRVIESGGYEAILYSQGHNLENVWSNDFDSQDFVDARALQSCMQFSGSRGPHVPCTFWGLMIVPVDISKKTWRRVGMYRFHDSRLGMEITPDGEGWEKATDIVLV